MKQEFVTVGRWTLRCDDVSGVTNSGCVVGMIVGGREKSIVLLSPEDATAARRRVEDAVGFTQQRIDDITGRARDALPRVKDNNGPYMMEKDGFWGFRYMNETTGKLSMAPGLDTTDRDPLVVALAAAKHAGVTE